MAIDICEGEGLYLPIEHCNDCMELENRVAALEAILDGVRRISFSKMDSDSTQNGFFLGEVHHG